MEISENKENFNSNVEDPNDNSDTDSNYDELANELLWLVLI